MQNNIRKSQEKYYRELYHKHKGTPMAVSSESLEHKKLRFEQIVRIFSHDDDFTVHEVGMGLADLNSFIQNRLKHKNIIYSGSDILKEFVEESCIRFPNLNFYHRDLAKKPYSDFYDYVVMSGLFHQRRENTIREWERYVCAILKNSFKMCTKGIAFNLISPFVDYYQDNVYYSNLPKIVNFINDELSRFFEIRHHYALFEYTVYVYKKKYIHSQYNQKEFNKYF